MPSTLASMHVPGLIATNQHLYSHVFPAGEKAHGKSPIVQWASIHGFPYQHKTEATETPCKFLFQVPQEDKWGKVLVITKNWDKIF
ncbi:hypothetical protein BTVI_92047 [Pitangus sulphuratus]|nr:hypothetical protein BTVI_92047 [Pitangus sulphuratus]